MRYRDYKTFRAGHYYHIFNRGADKQAIFFNGGDYAQFLKRFKLVLGLPSVKLLVTRIKPLPPKTFTILAYCLMPNHFHMLIRQNTDIGVNVLMLKLATSYSTYVNKTYDRVGTLFQDRFKAKLVDNDSYARYVSAYIHNNPSKPKEYAYSSCRDILGLRNGEICDRELLLSWFGNSVQQYEDFVDGFTRQEDIFKQQFSF